MLSKGTITGAEHKQLQCLIIVVTNNPAVASLRSVFSLAIRPAEVWQCALDRIHMQDLREGPSGTPTKTFSLKATVLLYQKR